MTSVNLSRPIPFLFLILAMMSCALPGTALSGGSSGVDPTTGGNPATSGSGACVNSLLPVVAGATWTYQGSSDTVGNYSFTRTFSDLNTEGFTETNTYTSGITTTSKWKCASGGLTHLDAGTGAGNVSSSASNMVVDSISTTGVSLPASVTPGSTWSQTLNIKGTMTTSRGVSADATNDASTTCQTADTESVSVPAGTFNATKVTCSISMHIVSTVHGISVPVDVQSNTTTWYSAGVGLIKTVGTTSIGSATSELVSYNIP
jgi:hypothetical protein